MAIDPTKLSDIPEMRAEQIAAALVAEEEAVESAVAEPAPTERPAPEPEAAAPETAAAEAQPTEEVTDTEPQAPAIDPPDGLTDEERSEWSSLPPAAQKLIARRERDRTLELRRGQDKIAEREKAIEQERARAAQARDHYVQLAATVDPVIQRGRQIDWEQYSRENPAQAQTDWHQYRDREMRLANAIAQQQAEREQTIRSKIAREEEALLTAIPEWKADRTKAQSEMDAIRRSAVSRYGFASEELSGLADHRQALVLRDAMRYHELVAKQRQAAQTKVTAKPVPKVLKPGAAAEPRSVEQERVANVKAQLKGVRDPHAIAAKIASIL